MCHLSGSQEVEEDTDEDEDTETEDAGEVTPEEDNDEVKVSKKLEVCVPPPLV